MLSNDFQDLFEIYKAQFGQTFSYFDVIRDYKKMQLAIKLMQQALDGKRGVVTNKDVGIDYPDDAVT